MDFTVCDQVHACSRATNLNGHDDMDWIHRSIVHQLNLPNLHDVPANSNSAAATIVQSLGWHDPTGQMEMMALSNVLEFLYRRRPSTMLLIIPSLLLIRFRYRIAPLGPRNSASSPHAQAMRGRRGTPEAVILPSRGPRVMQVNLDGTGLENLVQVGTVTSAIRI
jgi:hypothetical protein